MKITFFEAKDYDRVWFGESAKEYGFEACFVEEEFCVAAVKGFAASEVVCMPLKNEFSQEEIIALRSKGIRAIMMLVDSEADSLRTGSLNGIPVITAARFSPRQIIQKQMGIISAVGNEAAA